MKQAVYSATGGVQQPWALDGLLGFVYLTGAKTDEAPAQPQQPAAEAAPMRPQLNQPTRNGLRTKTGGKSSF